MTTEMTEDEAFRIVLEQLGLSKERAYLYYLRIEMAKLGWRLFQFNAPTGLGLVVVTVCAKGNWRFTGRIPVIVVAQALQAQTSVHT